MSTWNPRETEEGIVFKITVAPRASQNAITGIQGDALKIKLTAPPVDGEANEACVRFLARLLGVAKNRIEIVSGQTGRHKTVKVAGYSREELFFALREEVPADGWIRKYNNVGNNERERRNGQ